MQRKHRESVIKIECSLPPEDTAQGTSESLLFFSNAIVKTRAIRAGLHEYKPMDFLIHEAHDSLYSDVSH